MSNSQVLKLLRAYESRNVTYIEPDGSWPIVWERAQGVQVWDADGNKYLDLTAAFGVAAAGHANPRVVRAGQQQMGKLLHAMGDVHPHALKAQLARELSRLTFERWAALERKEAKSQTQPGASTGKVIFGNSGFEAVEAALKTALLETGKPGVIAFEGAYHGLGYGALNATHRSLFRGPFQTQLGKFGHFVPFPGGEYVAADGRTVTSPEVTLERIQWMIRQLFHQHPIGAILMEPVQGRGGLRVPPPEFLPALRELCDEHGALLIADEVYTGFGRTGRWFACEHTGTVPDLICLGKALTGGFPLSACVGRADLMDQAWPPTAGEAIHTSTFLGHPVGCAMALAQLKEIERKKLVDRSTSLGKHLLDLLAHLNVPPSSLELSARGLGLMVGLELKHQDSTPATDVALQTIKAMLHRGFILLPEGEDANVIGFTPPLTITERQLAGAVRALQAVLADDGWPGRSPAASRRSRRRTPARRTKAVSRKRPATSNPTEPLPPISA